MSVARRLALALTLPALLATTTLTQAASLELSAGNDTKPVACGGELPAFLAGVKQEAHEDTHVSPGEQASSERRVCDNSDPEFTARLDEAVALGIEVEWRVFDLESRNRMYCMRPPESADSNARDAKLFDLAFFHKFSHSAKGVLYGESLSVMTSIFAA